MLRSAILLAVFSVSITAGCASTQWEHSGISDPNVADRQYQIDDGYCTAVASGSVSMPYIPQPTYTGSKFSGTVNTYGSGGYSTSQFRGSTQPAPNYGAALTSGMAQGYAMGAAIRAKRDRERVYNGCMMSRGWSESSDSAVKPTRGASGAYAADSHASSYSQAALNPIEDVYQLVPTLADWRENDPEMWNRAVELDEELRSDAQYQGIPDEQRLRNIVYVLELE